MKLLVRPPNWVGDCILATPFLSLLKERNPGARITALAAPRTAPVLNGHPAIDEIRTFNGFGEALRICRAGRFEAAYILPGSFSSALPCFLAGIPRRIGYGGQARSWMLTETLEMKGPQHRAFSYARLADPGLEESHFKPARYPVSLAMPADKDSLFPEMEGQNWIALNPCSQFPSRRWDASRYSALARRLVKESGARVLLVGGPAQSERALASQVEREAGVPVLNLAGRTTFAELVCVLSRARLLVTSDTGIMHAACAVKTPVLVLAGAGDMRVTCPWGENFSIINKEVHCSPCVKNYCVNKEEPMLCMRSIEVEEVYRNIERLMRRN